MNSMMNFDLSKC